MIAAYQIFRDNQSELDPLLVIAGGRSWKRPEMMLAVSASPYRDDIRLIGPLDDAALGVWYREAQAVVYPSLDEGFGLPVLEAMGCGAAVLTSRAGAIPEVGGDAVRYCDPTEVDAIADGLESLLTDAARNRELRRRAVDQAARFSWGASAQAHGRLLGEVANFG